MHIYSAQFDILPLHKMQCSKCLQKRQKLKFLGYTKKKLRRGKPTHNPHCECGGTTIMLWGGFIPTGLTKPVRGEGKMNGAKYSTNLDKNLPEGERTEAG